MEEEIGSIIYIFEHWGSSYFKTKVSCYADLRTKWKNVTQWGYTYWWLLDICKHKIVFLVVKSTYITQKTKKFTYWTENQNQMFTAIVFVTSCILAVAYINKWSFTKYIGSMAIIWRLMEIAFVIPVLYYSMYWIEITCCLRVNFWHS